MGMSIGSKFPSVTVPQVADAAGGKSGVEGAFGGRKIAAAAEAGGALPNGIRQSIGQTRVSQSGLASVREALGLGVGSVDKATEADLTRTDALGGIINKAFNLKAPQFDGSRFQD